MPLTLQDLEHLHPGQTLRHVTGGHAVTGGQVVQGVLTCRWHDGNRDIWERLEPHQVEAMLVE